MAVKVPVKAATTANITLSGEQTIDGVSCVSGDRVLVKDQTTASANGIYDVDTGTWTRALDFAGAFNIVKGTLIYVNPGGTSNGDAWFRISTDDPITIGTTSLAFARQNINYFSAVSFTASAGQTLFNLGTTYQTGSNALAAYVNGIKVFLGANRDYTETSSSSITFNTGLNAGDELDVYIGQSVGSLTAAAASSVAISDAGDFYIATTAEAALQEIVENIAADNGDADATFSNGSSARVQRWNTTLTANRTLTLSTTNAKEGAHCTAVRGAGATGNFTLAVGSLATLRAPGEWARCVYDAGTGAWILEAYGILPSAEVLAVSADKGDASANVTVGTSERTQRWATALTAERSADLQTTGAYNGARFCIKRTESSTGNFALSVKTGSTVLARLFTGQFCDVEYTGSAWLVTGFGDLRTQNTAIVQLFDDFLGEEIDAYRWQSLVGTDAECRQATVRADQANGVVRLTTGDDAAASMAVNGVQMQSRLNWRADKGGLSYEVRVAIDTITSVAVFVGLTDQVSALEMPFTLAAGDALTSNATDACGVLFDTAADTDRWWLVGVKADVDATKQDSAVAPTAGTFEAWRIDIDATGQATFYRNGSLIGSAMANALTASVLLTPVVATFSRTSASRNVDVDHKLVQQQR